MIGIHTSKMGLIKWHFITPSKIIRFKKNGLWRQIDNFLILERFDEYIDKKRREKDTREEKKIQGKIKR